MPAWSGCTRKTCPCRKPTPVRTQAEAAENYKRWRRLEAQILCARARAVNGWLEAGAQLRAFRFTPDELLSAMASGHAYWHRAYWRVVAPWSA